MADCRQVTTSLPDKDAAEELASRLIQERLAACAQVVGPVSSTYWWQGGIHHAQEWLCHFKTSAARLPLLMERIRRLHPYDLPEVVAVTISDGDPDYLRWIEDEISK
jgi:periplasmic divalent cation tolerance protein